MTASRLRTISSFSCAALLAAGAAGCSRARTVAAPAGEPATFRGVYEAGPDRSAFIPCGSGDQWYVGTENAAARELRRLMNPRTCCTCDSAALAAWYQKHLGMPLADFGGAILRWPDDTGEDRGVTVWHIAAGSTGA